MLDDYRPLLVNLFDSVHRLQQDPWGLRLLCLEIQERLIAERTSIERTIRQCRDEVASRKRRLRSKGEPRLDKQAAQHIQGRIQNSLDTVDRCRDVLQILGSIGDALAHIYLPSWDIKHLSLKETSGFISGKEGFQKEHDTLRAIFEHGGVAIMADLTNSVRYGDLIALGKQGLQILEVKSSKHSNRRTRRQQRKLDGLASFLSADSDTPTDYFLEGWEAWRVIRYDLRSEEADHREKLNYLIRRAYRKGFASHEVEPGLYYAALKGHMSRFHRFASSLKRRITGAPQVWYLNMCKSWVPGYRPLVLSIQDAEALFDFYNGALSLLVIIDPQVIEDTLSASGLAVSFEPKEDIALEVKCQAPSEAGDLGPMRVGRIFFQRIPFEFLSLGWALREIIAIYLQTPTTKSTQLVRNSSG